MRWCGFQYLPCVKLLVTVEGWLDRNVYLLGLRRGPQAILMPMCQFTVHTALGILTSWGWSYLLTAVAL